MKELEEESDLIRRYLLGALPEAEQELFEQRVLCEPEYRDKVELVEDELVEDYARGALPDADHERFVGHFLTTPGQLQKLQLVQALRQYADAASPAAPLKAAARADEPGETRRPKLPFWRASPLRLGFALAVACLLVLGSALLLNSWRQSNDRAALELELARLNGPDASDRPDTPALTATLTPMLTRDLAEANKITLPPDIELVALRLNLPSGPHTVFQAMLRTNEGHELFVISDLKARVTGDGRQLVLRVPAALLTRGDYRLTLKGLDASNQPEEVAEYYFRVATRPQD
jgi:hypothetical protein